MSAPSRGTERPARLAVVGAASDEGARVRSALEARRVSGASVDLFGARRAEAVISEYDGEARLIQEPDLDEIGSRDVVFLCERDELAERVAAAARRTLVIDVVGALAAGSDSTRVHLGIRGDAVPRRGAGRLAVPHSLSLVLLDVLAPLDRALTLESATAVVLRPASDAGDAGIDELRLQTVRLLNFESVPTETFGRQLAFNLIHDGGASDTAPPLHERVQAEVDDLLGWPAGRLALDLVTVPVFFGHGIALRVRGRERFRPEAAAAALGEAGLTLALEGDAPRGPIDVTGEMRTLVAGLREDGAGGGWVWIVAGEAADRAAEHAVRVAARAVGL